MKIRNNYIAAFIFSLFFLASCSKDEPTTDVSDDDISGVMKIEITLPDDYMDYRFTFSGGITHTGLIAKDDTNITYVNKDNHIYVADDAPVLLVDGSAKHTFFTTPHTLIFNFIFGSNLQGRTDVPENVSITVKSYFNNKEIQSKVFDAKFGGFTLATGANKTEIIPRTN